jgi:hypothetical protein
MTKCDPIVYHMIMYSTVQYDILYRFKYTVITVTFQVN